MLRTTLNRSKVVAKQFSAKNGLTLAPASVSAANFRQFSAQKEADPTELIKDIVHSAVTLAGEVVPWFTKNMPAAYFKQVTPEMRTQHLRAISAIRDLNQEHMALKLESKLPDGTIQYTFLNSNEHSGVLFSQLKSLEVPVGFQLSNVKVFSSGDSSLSLNIFSMSPTSGTIQTASLEDATHITSFIKEVREGQHTGDAGVPSYSELFSEESLGAYLKNCSKSYSTNSGARRFLIQREMYEKIRNTDNTVVHVEPVRMGVTSHGTRNEKMVWISIAAANVLPEVIFRLSSGMLHARKIDIHRAHLDSVHDPENSTAELAGNVTMLRMLVESVDGEDLSADSEFTQRLVKDLKRAKWLDPEVVDLGLNSFPNLGIEKAEVIYCFCSMLHAPLAKMNPNAFPSITSSLSMLKSNPVYMGVAEQIADLFLERFNPASPLSETSFREREKSIRAKSNNLQLDTVKLVLDKMMDGVAATLRTNVYNEDRYALSLRLHPSIMVSSDRVMPFGVMFMHGRHFNGFHNRFRDIARGGARVVTPLTSDQFSLESTRQYDEAYGLSYAQQLKNKDIPEGGSKGVILVNTPAIHPNARFFAMRKAVKAYADSMLDLMVEDSVKNLVDLYGKEEIVYLGPDEQIIPSDIAWIIKRAGQRGYPNPAAFMSSKKDDGFNHKEFGVTSEGIVVFLDVAVRRVLNIDPHKEPFTIKVTGGPDGDVAGNLLKILFREYGSNCKVLGVSDGFGVAEDPEGLDMDELLRLVEEGSSIVEFNKAKLSTAGVHFDVKSEEGNARRNSMHNRIKADVFVPGGGRPNTINGSNWDQFLLADGTPSSPLIVEGANIFTTPEARQLLHDRAGVSIVKDSSANKCGVITSSCEVQASMLLTKKEFMDNKPALVHDVLERLRFLARVEGELMFKEYKNYPGNLPHFSERISNAINRTTDAITELLADYEPSDPLFQELVPVIRQNLPAKLAELGGDRISERYPIQYQRNAIATAIASHLVYQEGIHLVETQPSDRLAERAIMYHREHVKMQSLLQKLETHDFGGDASSKDAVLKIIRKSGARASVDSF